MSEKKLIPSDTVFLIDGSSFLYRAYYALKALHTSQGVPVHAIYGFCRMIKKIIDRFQSEYIAIVWDSKGTNFRHEIYKDYKANRQAAPLDLFSQKEEIIKFAELIQLYQLQVPGVEADDLIFSLAIQLADAGKDVVIISSDKDMRQILTHNRVTIFDPFRDIFLTAESCKLRYGFEVEKLPFYFALIGDTSDNIPGVPGVGPKTATDFVVQFKSLDDLYANLDQVKSKRIKELLEKHKADAYISLQLFTMQKQIIETSIEDTAFKKENWALALPFFKTHEMKSLIKETETAFKLVSQDRIITLHDDYNFICVQTEEQLDAMCKEIYAAQECAIDTETDGGDPMTNLCVGMSFSSNHGTSYYLPIRHNTQEPQLELSIVQKYLTPLLADMGVKKYMHHAKFDELVLSRTGLPVSNMTFDTLIAASLLVPDWQKKGLKDLSEFYFNEPMRHFDETLFTHKCKFFSQVPLKEATQYAAADAHQTMKLYKIFSEELVKTGLDKVFYTIEMPTHHILLAMQQQGIICDAAVLKNLEATVLAQLEAVEKEIIDLTGTFGVNLNSPSQVEHLLFTTLKLPAQRKSTKKTGYSTDAEVLSTLAHLHPVPKLILRYRELSKLKNTYIESLPTYINPKTGRIHSSFNQSMVATGRLSSSNPNLQNIPTETEIDIRAAFHAQEGHVFISADYAQIELKILAHFSQDAKLLDAFKNNKDIHKETAGHLFDVPADEVTREQRSVGKTINFSILYGLTPYGLSKGLHIPFAQAKKYIETYFEQYPGIQEWMEETLQLAQARGYSETLHGRRRYVPGIHDKNKVVFELAKRIAINSPVQGSAAEIMKIGMINVEKNMKTLNIPGYIILQIHDEIIVSCPKAYEAQAAQCIKESLESVVDWEVKLNVETKNGFTWRDVTK